MNDNTTIKYHRLFASEIAIIVPVTFAGLLIVNVVFSTLISFFDRPRLQLKINSIEDLYRSNVKIFASLSFDIYLGDGVTQNELVDFLNEQYHRDDWNTKLLISKEDFYETKFLSQESPIEFIISKKVAQGWLDAQKRLDVCVDRIPYQFSALRTMLFSFRINDTFPFIERFNEIFHRNFFHV